MPRNKEPIIDQDNPEWTEETFARATRFPAGTKLGDVARELAAGKTLDQAAAAIVRKRGRPKLDDPKEMVTLRVDADVLAAYRKTGPGWQSQINADLRKARKLKAS